MESSECGSGTGIRGPFDHPYSTSPQSTMTSTNDLISKINQQINLLKEDARRRECSSDRFEEHLTFPCSQHLYRSDDFVNDDLSEHGNVDFVALDRLRDGDGRNDFGSMEMQESLNFSTRWVGWRSQDKERWAGPSHFRNRKESYPVLGRGGQNGSYLSHHEDHDLPAWHFRSGQSAKFRKPHGQAGTIQTGRLVEPGESGTVGGIRRPLSPPRKDLGVDPEVINRRKEKAKLKRRRQRALKAAAKAQAVQDLGTTVSLDNMADLTCARQQLKPEKEELKRKENLSAADEPEFKRVRTASTGDSSEQMEAAVTSAASASSPGAEAQSKVLSIEEELAQLKQKLQNKKTSLSSRVAAGHPKETSEDITPVPGGVDLEEKVSFDGPGKITAERMTFVCAVCKFQSFYRKNLDAHLESQFHKDHIMFLSEHLPEPAVDVLQTYFSSMYEKVDEVINRMPDHRTVICQLYEDQDLTRDLNMEHFMKKAETAHCQACDVYVPMQHPIIQQHLQSPDHINNCKGMMVKSKNSGLSVAKNVLSHSKKFQLNLKDSTGTDGTDETPVEEVSTGQRADLDTETDVMNQEAEPLSEGVDPDAGKTRNEEERHLMEVRFDVMNEAGEGVEMGGDEP